MMKRIIAIATFAITSLLTAQESKIIIVENNLAELGTFDKYYLHTYTKQFFKADGYTVYFENNLPEELVNNRCAAIFVNYQDNSNMFTTKLVLKLKDCYGNIIFESDEGISKAKTYNTAYRQAMLNATKSFKAKKGSIKFNQVLANNKSENKIIESQPKIDKNNTIDNLKFDFENNKLEGFLKNEKDEVLFKITKTSIENLYTASNNYVDGIIFKKENKWFFEFSRNGEKVTEEIK